MKKSKIKTIVKRIEVAPKEYEVNKVKADIENLEAKRNQMPSGIKGFFSRMSINRKINQKAAFLSAKDRLRATRVQTELGKAMLEKEKVKLEFTELKKKNQVNFNDLYKGL